MAVVLSFMQPMSSRDCLHIHTPAISTIQSSFPYSVDRIIYELIDDVKESLAKLLPPKITFVQTGAAEVLQVCMHCVYFVYLRAIMVTDKRKN